MSGAMPEHDLHAPFTHRLAVPAAADHTRRGRWTPVDDEPEAAVEELLERSAGLPERTYAPGEALVTDGTRHRELLVLVSGELEVRKGGVRISTIDQPGVVIGEVGLLLGTPATATVVAASPVTVRVADDGEAWLRNDPELTFVVARMLAQRLDLVTSFLADLRAQYGAERGSLAVVDDVLASLVQRPGTTARPGSAREPDPPY